MATTIDRTGITLTNDTGTPASPNGDGTLLSAADRTALLDAFDDVFAGNVLIGGTLGAEGFGTHSLSAGGTGTQNLIVRNTTAGTTNGAEISVGNDGSSTAGRIYHTSSTYTPSVPFLADSFNVFGTRAGGLGLGTIGAYDTRLYTNSLARVTVDSGGLVAVGASVDTNIGTLLNQTFTPASAAAAGALAKISGTITGQANANTIGLWVNPTIAEAASGTHSVVAGLFCSAPTITAGGGSVTTAATVYVGGAPSASGAENFSVKIASGQTSLPDGSASAPTLCGGSAASSGIYWSSSATRVSVATQGVQCAEFAGSSVAAKTLTLPAAANGTGVTGQVVSIGRNTSGAGSAGVLTLGLLGGGSRHVWSSNAGDLMINSTAPSEAGGDTTGTVVGTQTSTRETKRDIRRFDDPDAALRLVAATPLYRFRYRETGDADTEHVGILADESPAFTRYGGTAFDPVNGFGYLCAAVQAIARRLDALEAR